MTDIFTDQLSDYLDEELPAAERAAVQAHVATCRECATTLDELRAVLERAASLPTRPPASDLWPGIEPRLSGIARESQVAAFKPRARRFSFTLPQIAAAGIALMVMSGGGVWVLLHGGRATTMPPVAATDPVSNPVLPAAMADAHYDEAIADLERALDAGRNELDPATITILESNLAAIDKAIGESRSALAADYANVYLNSHLADARQRKLALLRRAAALVGGKT
jgi:hypothetical protein